MLTLRPALASEADELTELCLRSKAAWGYDASFMAACRAELTMTPERIQASHVQVAELDGKIAGVARLCFGNGGAELAALFVEPDVRRAGIGRALFDWAVAECRAHTVTTMTMEADPGAAPFYRRMGARESAQCLRDRSRGASFPNLSLPSRSAGRRPQGLKSAAVSPRAVRADMPVARG